MDRRHPRLIRLNSQPNISEFLPGCGIRVPFGSDTGGLASPEEAGTDLANDES